MAEQIIKSKATEWIESIVKEHIHEPDTYSWSGLPDKPTMLIEKRNLRITFPKALFDDCSEAHSVSRSSVKDRLVMIMRDIKVREYRDKTFAFNEQSGWSTI